LLDDCNEIDMSSTLVATSDHRLIAPLAVSIVIPVHNGGESFRQCLESLKQCIPADTEVIIVVDGGTDRSCQLAKEFGAKVIQLPFAGGPAQARNLGAAIATGDLLFFVDADVTLKADTLIRVIAIFQKQPKLDALIGSYDDAPGADNFLSQYKNLFHHYTHQTGSEDASTFWGACGVIRRDLFLAIGGFDKAYRHPSVEDIELGYRLKKMGSSIRLCKQIQVKHLKCWRVGSLLKAEVFYRGVPWTELLWRDRPFNNDLNLNHSSRLSLLLTYALLLSLVAACWWLPVLVIAIAISLVLLSLNWSVYRFFYQKRGGWFALRVVPWHWFYFLYGGFAFALGTLRYYLRKPSYARFTQASTPSKLS
jgi:GT2 family glycosyltransferase